MGKVKDMQRHNYETNAPVFYGAGYDAGRDNVRLTKSLQATYDVLKCQQWRTLAYISAATNKPEASVSANIRSLRNPKNGGYCIDRRHAGDGLHKYRLDHAKPTNWAPKRKNDKTAEAKKLSLYLDGLITQDKVRFVYPGDKKEMQRLISAIFT